MFLITVPPLVIAVLVASLTRHSAPSSEALVRSAVGGAGRPVTYLVMTVRPGDLSRQADTMTLFSLGEAKPYALMIPPSAFTEIPGYGFDAVAKSLSFGRIPLADLTVENLLGVRVDHVAVLDGSAITRIVDRLGGVRVDVASDLYQSDGAGRLLPIFTRGEQKLSGKRALQYTTFEGSDETELSRLARVQQVWEALLGGYGAQRSEDLAKVAAGLGGLVDGDQSAAKFGTFLAAFASVRSRTFDVVPVTPIGSGDDGAFKVEDDQLASLVGTFLSGSASFKGPGRPRIQLLNGNGTPESGIAAADRLIPKGFWLVDSGNARSFQFSETKIVVYVNDEATMEAAQEVRRLLGVGQIELSKSLHTSIDVTVVIGKDFRGA